MTDGQKFWRYCKNTYVVLANYQGEDGFWHQLIDRNDSYLETSATAIYVFAIAKGHQQGLCGCSGLWAYGYPGMECCGYSNQ